MRIFLVLLVVFSAYVASNSPTKLPEHNSAACKAANPVVKLFAPVCDFMPRAEAD